MTTTPLLVYFLINFYIYSKLLASAEDDNQFIYNGFQGANLYHDRLAQIYPNGLLQLTNTSKRESGHAFYQLPIRFNDSSSGLPQTLSFSTNFVFVIVPENTDVSGHGIAFTISPSLNFTGALPAQYLGLLNTSNNSHPSNHLFAIEFDTINNPEFNDIDDNHVGIDVNNLASIASASAAYSSNSEGINKNLELKSGNPIQVWIDYDGVENLLNVTLAPIQSPKPNRPLLSTHIDLSPIFLDSMFVGFSSSTGSTASNHYILGWSFNKSGKSQSIEISKIPSFPQQKKPKGKPGIKVIVSLVTVSIMLIITIIGIVYCVRRKKYEEIQEDWEQEYGPQRFSYKDLYKSTKGFKSKELLGVGGFGKVYKGVLPSSKELIAVKKISHDSKQGMKEFVAEIVSMGRLRHRNLVRLLGYCRRRGELLLVYDYMPNGSLDKFLFGSEQPLNWAQRFQILRGVASALQYLHEEWEQVVLHRDVKASNVLLDANLNGRLGDFGLARLYDHGENPETTNVVGTLGYLAPEYTRTGKATTSTDVYGFGVFMLEVACGRKPIEPHRLPKERVLIDWVLENWKQEAILESSDPRLGGENLEEEMELILKLGLFCSHPNAMVRPSMRQVVQYLDGDALFPNDILLDIASIGTLDVCNEASSEFVMSFPSSVLKCSGESMSSSLMYSGQ